MGLPMDLGGYGEERLSKLDVAELRPECGRRGIDVKPQAQKMTCIKLLLDWKTAQAAATGLPFDLVNYGKERLEKLDVAALRTECALRGIDVKEKAQKSTCVAELLNWKASATTPAQKVCVVVGLGNQGIGDHVAKKWAAEGYRVALLARRKDNLDALEKAIDGSKGYQCDVTDRSKIDGVVEAIAKDLGPIDACVYNAGAGVFKNFEATSFDEFEASWRCGPAGLFLFAQAIIPGMVARGGGVFGITGATASWRGMPSTPAFASAKMGVRALAQSLCKEYAPKKVHVFHCIIDGVVDQPRTKAWFPADKPDNEFLSPATIANHYWAIAQQEESCWTFESNVCPASRMMEMLTI